MYVIQKIEIFDPPPLLHFVTFRLDPTSLYVTPHNVKNSADEMS